MSKNWQFLYKNNCKLLMKCIDIFIFCTYNLIKNPIYSLYKKVREEWNMYGDWMKDMPIIVGNDNKSNT